MDHDLDDKGNHQDAQNMESVKLQVTDLQSRIEDLEQKMKEYEKHNDGKLGSKMDSNKSNKLQESYPIHTDNSL